MRVPPRSPNRARLAAPGSVRARLAVRLSLLAVAAAALGAVAAAATAKPKLGDGVGEVELRKLGDFNQVTHVDNAPGFNGLLFVVEQPGKITVLRHNQPVGHAFLNIEDLVHCCGEQGLLSVAFAPDYEQSGRFYVYYTTDGGAVNRVDEFRRADSTTADPASRRTVIEIPHPTASNHNGGQLQFGPDGYLYIAPGDGAVSADNAQDPDSLLGKLLRIDPLPGNAGAYGIPPDNPFAGSKPGLGEIYSLGLRNPWRFSFDRKTGRLAIGDVGAGQWEEVNYETASTAKGANFGWPVFEGTHRMDQGAPEPANHQLPIHEYSHGGANCAITGGYVVRDPKLKPLYGRYLYADLCNGGLRSLVPRLEGARKDRALGPTVPFPTTFGEGAHGRIYVGSNNGGVWKLK